MAQIYVSYASKDRGVALRIIKAIERAGLSVWDTDAISMDNTIQEELRHGLVTSQCVVVLWSNAAAESQWVRQEIERAVQAWASDRLVLAVLDDTPLPIGLRDLLPISIEGASDSGTKQLIERAAAIVRRELPRPHVLLAPRAPPVLQEIVPPSASPRPRPHAALPLATFLLGGAAIMLAWLLLAPPTSIWKVPPDIFLQKTNSVSPLPFILMVLVLGAAIGAGAVRVWAAWSRRRSNRTLSAPSMVLSRQAPAPSIDAPQVFVSYSRQDGQTVEQLIQQIEQLGYAVWIDRQSTGPQRYAAPIVHAIRTSRLVVLMCSRNAFTSDHVIREVYVAGDYKKPFLVVQLDPTEFPDEILYFISGFPRLPVAAVNSQQLRSEIARLVAA